VAFAWLVASSVCFLPCDEKKFACGTFSPNPDPKIKQILDPQRPKQGEQAQNSASHLLIVSVLLTLRAVLDFAASMAKNLQVENMDEADFMTLGRWLMGNTKDMEVRGTPGRLGTHPPADQRALFFVPGS